LFNLWFALLVLHKVVENGQIEKRLSGNIKVLYVPGDDDIIMFENDSHNKSAKLDK